MKDYEVVIKVRNNYLVQRMREAGYTSANQLARAAGVHPTQLGELINLKAVGLTKKEEWRSILVKLANLLRCLPEDLIPPQHQRASLKTNQTAFEADIAEIADFVGCSESPEVIVNRADVARLIDRALEKLRPRQERVLRLRFGLDGNGERSVEEIGSVMGISETQVRSIQNQALRILRYRDVTARDAHKNELNGILADETLWGRG